LHPSQLECIYKGWVASIRVGSCIRVGFHVSALGASIRVGFFVSELGACIRIWLYVSGMESLF